MTNRGISLVEVLVAGVIAGVIALGSLRSLEFAMQAGGVSRAILNENDFKLTVSKALVDNCYGNLKPENLIGSEENTKKGIGELKKATPRDGLKLSIHDTEPTIKIGTFKGDIEVVKMEVTGDSSKECPDTGCKRDFVAYYKKTNLGELNTVAGKACTASDTAGCFKTQCQLKYTLDKTDTDNEEGGCESLTCHPVVLMAGVGGRFPCPWGQIYNQDHKTTNKLKCDPRDKPIGGSCSATGFANKTLFNSDQTGKKIKDGKCVCEEGGESQDVLRVWTSTISRLLTADGLCIRSMKAFGPSDCFPRGEGHNLTEDMKKLFCSKEYRGTEFCIHFSTNDGKEEYYKRVYNRETGNVRCVGFKTEHTPNGEKKEPDASWFMPHFQ